MSSPKHSTRTTYPSKAFYSILAEIRTEQRARELPEMCSQFLGELHNDEQDPRLVLGDLPYALVMRAAMKSPAVRRVAAILEAQYPDYWDSRR